MEKKQKTLLKIISKAELIDRAEINGSKVNVIEDIENFYNQKGKVFFVKSENVLYKFDGINWFKLAEREKDKIQKLPQENNIKEIKGAVLGKEVKQDKYTEFVIWANKFKEYVDNKFKEIEVRQETILKIVKENIDLKIKSLGKKK